jgi:hypothetical protein
MATNTFKRYASRSVGTSATAVGAYTVPANTQVTMIGLSIANVTNTALSVTATLYDGADSTNIVKNAPLLSGSTIIIAGGDQKIVMQPGDQIRVSSTVSSSIDAILSILEIA